MLTVTRHANQVTDEKFGRLSKDTAAKKMSASAPVLFTPVIALVAVVVALNASNSI
jgi:hypothetical protein